MLKEAAQRVLCLWDIGTFFFFFFTAYRHIYFLVYGI